MPRMYSSSVRRQIVARLRSGEPVAVVAAETGVGQATLFRWRRQALIDAGVIECIPSVEADELAAAHKLRWSGGPEAVCRSRPFAHDRWSLAARLPTLCWGG
jgi:transposase-like protein